MALLKSAISRQPKLPRFICHLYQRLSQGRLNLVTGAGISIDAGVPSWYQLLDRLAERTEDLKADFQLHRSSGLNPEYLGQIIYHRLRKECSATNTLNYAIDHSWAKEIHTAIYKDAKNGIKEILDVHPYMTELRNLAYRVSLVINFNFDDILAEAMSEHGVSSTFRRASTVVWHPPLVERENSTTIYHVNGLLPRASLKKRSPQLIFTEDSFSDAVSRSPGVSGEYIFLRFVQHTMLIIGHSLNDTSLKNYLRKNRDKCPANHHYVIYWIDENKVMSDQQLNDIFEANLELYNLITIFLTTNEIKEFLMLLNMNERDFKDAFDNLEIGETNRYHYYIVGPVAAGKSSILEQLRCFQTHEEWTRTAPQEMYLSFKKLDENQRKTVNQFIYSELKEKNKRMHEAKTGFHFMDRAPLDLYAFSHDDEERKEKTKEIKNKVTRDNELRAGQIIFVTANPKTLVKRNASRGRESENSGEADYLKNQSQFLKDLYKPVFIVKTDQKTPGEAAKDIARQALLKDYKPTDLSKIMDKYNEQN